MVIFNFCKIQYRLAKKNIVYLCLIAISTLLDQLSKSFFISYLKTQSSYSKTLLPFCDLVYAWNYGISFGLFHEYYQYSNIIFAIVNSLIIFYLFYMLCTAENQTMRFSLSLIIGGAIGNLIDRIFRGGVFDFIYLHYYDLHFSVFNIADSFISIGACIFIVKYLASTRTK